MRNKYAPIDYHVEPYDGERDEFVGQPGCVAGAGMQAKALLSMLEVVAAYGLMELFLDENKDRVAKIRSFMEVPQ